MNIASGISFFWLRPCLVAIIEVNSNFPTCILPPRPFHIGVLPWGGWGGAELSPSYIIACNRLCYAEVLCVSSLSFAIQVNLLHSHPFSFIIVTALVFFHFNKLLLTFFFIWWVILYAIHCSSRSRNLQNRRIFLRILGEQRRKRSERETRVAREGRSAKKNYASSVG